MMEKQRVYISGKMRFMDEEESRRLFAEAQENLEAQGFDVINPWDLEDEKMRQCAEWAEFILFDLKIVKTCDKIYMLNNWKDSFGAKTEFDFASGHGLDILYQENPFPKVDEIKPVLVLELPKSAKDMKQGVLYLKQNKEDGTYESFHLCPCGCGEPVYLQYGGKGWDLKLNMEGDELKSVTINPSVGCFDFPCKSHYFIRDNKIIWV